MGRNQLWHGCRTKERSRRLSPKSCRMIFLFRVEFGPRRFWPHPKIAFNCAPIKRALIGVKAGVIKVL